MRLSEQLKRRVLADPVLSKIPGIENHDPVRTYASRAWLSAGAFKWEMGNVIGSQWSMLACVRADSWDVYRHPDDHDYHITPC